MNELHVFIKRERAYFGDNTKMKSNKMKRLIEEVI